jgi:Icc-related predicted phosphoesterase
MKILAASDTHGDKRIISDLAKRAKDEDVDLIVLCGDITFAEADLTGLIGPFKQINKKVVLIPGNHETFATAEFLAKQYSPGVYNIHGRSILLYNEIGLFGCGSSNIGIFEMTESEVKSALKKAFKPIKDAKRKILITHTPPYGTKLDALWSHVGSKGVKEIIEETKPDLCLCGHIHETFGKHDKVGETEVINVGPKGIIINIPPKTNSKENKIILK